MGRPEAVILGRFREHLPRLSLMLPGREGSITVEFIVDTGFEGDFTLPGDILRQLDSQPLFLSIRSLADGALRECPVHRMEFDWNGETREVEVLALESNPLVGTYLLDGCRLEIEMEEGGEVVIELPG